MVAWKGSPNSSGTWYGGAGYPSDENIPSDSRLAAILAKQKALKALFAQDNRSLVIQPYDGSTPTTYQVRVKKIDFPEGNWWELSEYTIELEAYDKSIRDVSEAWDIEILDEKVGTYRLTHNVSVSSLQLYDSNGNFTLSSWENARNYALNTLGLGLKAERMIASGVLDANNLQAYNYLRSQKLDERRGTFDVTETWLCYDPGSGQPPAYEEFNVNSRTTEEGRTTVTVDGTINGLEVRNNTTHSLVSTRWTNAASKWTNVSSNLFSRAQTISGVTLNPAAVNRQTGSNEINGVVTYSYEYNDRPSASVSGAISENITIVNHNPTDVFASIPVLGRALGPVLQNIGTVTSRKRSVSIDAVMRVKTQTFTPTEPNTDLLVLTHVPSGSVVFVDEDTSSYSETTGRYSRQTSFTWEA